MKNQRLSLELIPNPKIKPNIDKTDGQTNKLWNVEKTFTEKFQVPSGDSNVPQQCAYNWIGSGVKKIIWQFWNLFLTDFKKKTQKSKIIEKFDQMM